METGTGALYTDTSLNISNLPAQDHRRALGLALLQGPRGVLFRMSEVPLYLHAYIHPKAGHGVGGGGGGAIGGGEVLEGARALRRGFRAFAGRCSHVRT